MVRALTAATVAIAATGIPSGGRADDFYAGKTITISTHSAPGSGYDTYARLMSRHYGRHIPGNPSFVVANQPGAGGLLAVNHAGRVAPKDGTFLTLVSQGILVIEATGGEGLQTSLRDFRWIGNLSQSNNVTVTWTASNVKTIDDAKARDVSVGATGAGSATVVGPTLYNSLIGTRFKIIQGYNGSGQINLAMQRGEIDGHANSTWTSIKTTVFEEFKQGKISVLIQMGLNKERDLPNVPLLSELVKGDANKEAIAKFMSTAVSVARPFAAVPGVPNGRVTILRGAFDAAVKDNDLVGEANKLGSDVDPMSGADTEAAILSVLSTPKAVVDHVKDMLK